MFTGRAVPSQQARDSGQRARGREGPEEVERGFPVSRAPHPSPGGQCCSEGGTYSWRSRRSWTEHSPVTSSPPTGTGNTTLRSGRPDGEGVAFPGPGSPPAAPTSPWASVLCYRVSNEGTVMGTLPPLHRQVMLSHGKTTAGRGLMTAQDQTPEAEPGLKATCPTAAPAPKHHPAPLCSRPASPGTPTLWPRV